MSEMRRLHSIELNTELLSALLDGGPSREELDALREELDTDMANAARILKTSDHSPIRGTAMTLRDILKELERRARTYGETLGRESN